MKWLEKIFPILAIKKAEKEVRLLQVECARNFGYLFEKVATLQQLIDSASADITGFRRNTFNERLKKLEAFYQEKLNSETRTYEAPCS